MNYPSFRKMETASHSSIRSDETHAFAAGEDSRSDLHLSGEKPENQNTDSRTAHALDFVVTFSLGAIFFGLPLFFTGLAFQGLAFEKQMYFYVWILLALVAWAAKGVIVGEMKIRRTPLDLPILAFVLVYGIVTLTSIDRWHSFLGAFGDPSRGFVGVIALVVAYYMLFSTATRKKMYLFLGLMIFSSSLVSLWSALAIMNFMPQKMMSVVPANLLGSFSSLVVLVSCMIPIAMAAILKIRDGRYSRMTQRILTVGLLGSLLVDLFLLLALNAFVSWSGWMSLIIGVVLFLVYVLSGVVKTKQFSWTWLPMAVFIVLMVLLMSGPISIVRTNLPTEVSLNTATSWTIAKESLKKNFFLGSGPATYGFDFSLRRPQELNQSTLYNLRFYQGTGLFFEALSTIGTLATFFLAVVAFSFISIGFYLLSHSKGKNAMIGLGLFSASIIFIIDVLTATASGPIILIGCLLATVAMFFLVEERGIKENFLMLSLKASAKYALALAFIFMVISASVIYLFVFIGKAYAADVYAGLSNRSQNITEASVGKLVKAVNLYGKEAKYYSLLGQEFGVLANAEAAKDTKQRNVENVKNNLNYSISAAIQGRDLNKNDVGAVEVLAQIYENSGLYVADSLNLALDNYKRALELEPHNPVYFLKIGEIRLSQAANEKDDASKKAAVEDAKSWLQKSVNEKSNLAEAQYQLGSVQEILGDHDGAILSLQKAIAADKTNANYFLEIGNVYTARATGDDYKNAESTYKSILAVNNKDLNTYLSLGFLYEKMKKFSDAGVQYKKVSELLSDQNPDQKKQIQKMIDNVNRGVENTPENLKTSAVSDNPAVSSEQPLENNIQQ